MCVCFVAYVCVCVCEYIGMQSCEVKMGIILLSQVRQGTEGNSGPSETVPGARGRGRTHSSSSPAVDKSSHASQVHTPLNCISFPSLCLSLRFSLSLSVCVCVCVCV